MWLLAIAIFLLFVIYLIIRPYKYWTDKGIDPGPPLLFYLQNFKRIIRSESLGEFIQIAYNKTPNSRYTGVTQFLAIPIFVVRDPDLLKLVTVKDFDHFVDHVSVISEDADPIWARNLFALQGQKWRRMRATLSPAFTGSKMRNIFTLIDQNAEDFVNHFLKKNEDVIEIEFKQVFSRFTLDVIANTAFGVKINSLENPDNDFYRLGKSLTDFSSLLKMMKIFGFFVFPRLYKWFQIKLFSQEEEDFFVDLIQENIERREKDHIVRPDMIHLLLEAKKNGLKKELPSEQDAGFATAADEGNAEEKTEITNEVITSQALIFFFAGFDAIATIMCFLAYELAINPDIQERLRREIDETAKSCNGKITYEDLMKMKYLDMVVSETLRKWPGSPTIDRECTKDYVIEPVSPGEKPVHLRKGDKMWFPVFAFHRDPKYYPEPEKFDPERFSDENKHTIKPYTYFPFGVGPRNCIGSRFALMEVKILIFRILQHFQLVPVAKSRVPLKLDTSTFGLHSEGGFWFALKKRVQ